MSHMKLISKVRGHSYIDFHGKVRHLTFWVYPHPPSERHTKNETLSCAITLSYHVMAPSSVCWYSMLHSHSAQQCYVEKLWPQTRRLIVFLANVNPRKHSSRMFD